MGEMYFQKRQREAGERLRALLDLPVPTIDIELGSEGFFDPWDMFRVYGSYSSEFDEVYLARPS